MNDGDRKTEFLYFSAGHELAYGILGRAVGGICSEEKGVGSLIEMAGNEIQTGNVSWSNSTLL